MNKLTITLKQHTPMLHFQHGQEGVGLRASEVKPKLDKFIIQKVRQTGRFNTSWLVGGGKHEALDYKMRIICSNDYDEYLFASMLANKIDKKKIHDFETSREKQNSTHNIYVIPMSPYFAQVNAKNIVKDFVNSKKTDNWDRSTCKGIFWNNDIQIEMFSFHQEIISEIHKYIQAFFLCENFGTRQSKGFGCFTVESINGKKEGLNTDIKAILKEEFTICYCSEALKGIETEPKHVIIKRAFEKILRDSNLLKSGLNNPQFGSYANSKLMLYAQNKNANRPRDNRWDKRFIKKQFIGNCPPYKLVSKHQQDGIPDGETYLYYRALLGLAQQYEFLLENPPKEQYKTKDGKLKEREGKMISKLKSTDIARYKSPIMFKVINNKIYLLGNDIPDEMFGHRFKLDIRIQLDNHARCRIPYNRLFTPNRNQFNLAEFIDFAMKDSTDDAKLGYTTF